MPKIFIIAGPNGAGKTSFAREYLPHEGACPEFVNADLIAAGISPFRPEDAAFAAGRAMMDRIGELVRRGESLAFETTLASRSFIRLIPAWQQAGYQVKLCFLKLRSPELAIQRVAQRIELGGHAIPKATIRRRFERGWQNFQDHYRDLADEWVIYDSSGDCYKVIDSSDQSQPPRLMEEEPTDEREPTQEKWVFTDPDFQGIEAAWLRAAKKAIAEAKAAGLEPVVRNPEDADGS